MNPEDEKSCGEGTIRDVGDYHAKNEGLQWRT